MITERDLVAGHAQDPNGVPADTLTIVIYAAYDGTDTKSQGPAGNYSAGP